MSEQSVSRYDAADNARKSYVLGIKQTRLANIRTGKFRPRAHVQEEVEAWREGVRARRIIAGAIAAAFSIVFGLAYGIDGTPPEGNGGALASMENTTAARGQ